jgi:hypothetical protein
MTEDGIARDRTSRFEWGTPLERACAVAAVCWVAVLSLTQPVIPNDFWWHMALGRTIVAEQRIPVADVFSFTRHGGAWHDQQWLGQVTLYGAYRIGGLAAVVLVHAGAIALAYFLLLRLLVLRSRDIGLSAAVLVLAIVPISLDNWTVRPQSLVLPLFVGCLSIVEAHRAARPARLVLLPLLTLVWVNMHGSFPLGIALMVLGVVGLLTDRYLPLSAGLSSREQQIAGLSARRLLAWAAVAAGAAVANPHGASAYTYVSALMRNATVTELATEWAPPTIRTGEGAAFFVFVIACGLVAAYGSKRPRPSDAVLFLPFLWLALSAGRNVIWFAFVSAPMLAERVSLAVVPRVTVTSNEPRPQQAERTASRADRSLAAAIVIVSILAVVVSLPWLKSRWWSEPRGRLLAKGTPVGAVAFLKADAVRPSRLFHSVAYGSYLMWAAPEQPVFADPRLELYPREQWNDYIELSQGRNVDVLIGKYRFDGLMLDTRQQRLLVDALRGRPVEWVERYRDETSVYFVARAVLAR